VRCRQRSCRQCFTTLSADRGRARDGTAGVGALYPALSPGTSGLTKTSYALIDHLRSIDKRRIRRLYGQVSSSELAGIDQGLELFLCLGG
jgi:mRNA interferase MazF